MYDNHTMKESTISPTSKEIIACNNISSNTPTTATNSPMSCGSFPQHHNEHDDHHHHSDHRVETRAVLKHMRRLEATTYKWPTAKKLPEPFNGLWREQIIQWMYTLVKYCNLRHESAAAASYYLDVAVCKGLVQSPNDYQLGAMTALYLALKVYDSPNLRVVKLSSLVKLGNGEFNEQDIQRMERDLVKLLDWRLNPPTPNCFLQQYLTLLPSNQRTKDQIEEIAFQAIEHTTARDLFLAAPPSVIAYSAILMAIEAVDQQHQQERHQLMTNEHHHQQHHSTDSSMSLMDLQTFLWNMTHIARLDNTSPCLVRTSILLDRTMKSLPVPVTYTDLDAMCGCVDTQDCNHDDDHENDDSLHRGSKDTQHQDGEYYLDDPTAMPFENGHSPNHVSMQ
jgi:hypothetical protein